MTKVLICGSRSIMDESWIFEQIDAFIRDYKLDMGSLTIIEGGAKGVDSVAGKWAENHGVQKEVHKADWARYGRGAGLRRNADMVLSADMVLILWDGISKGTRNDIDLCKKHLKTYKIVVKEK